MRALTLVFVIGLAVATTADGALAQNTLLLGRGQPPRQTTVPLTTYPNYGNRPSGQFFAPAQPQAYRMLSSLLSAADRTGFAVDHRFDR